MGEQIKVNYGGAVGHALDRALSKWPETILYGEDLAVPGGVFGVTRGLRAKYGERVFDTPISEAALVGLGVGAAATGTRPIIDIMFMDFLGIAMDQLVNQAAKMKYMFGGSVQLPLTIHTMAGAGMSMAAQHSQSLEAWLCHVPGLKVVMPSGAYEAKGLLLSAIFDDNPVVVINSKTSLGQRAPVPEEPYRLPLGQAAVVREGRDVTVVALGRMVTEARKAAEELAGDGIEVEIVDPRTLSPFDTATVVSSVEKTNRCVVAHEAVRFGGFGGEIVAQIQEQAFDHLDAPIGRVGAPFCPVPFSPVLEQQYVPNAEWIAAAVRDTLGRG